ncbi:MAG: hypothetical protein ISS93_01690 [Candidatus Aenigmarchaeota archaeon]|nr:hypothetical protein [Candidatus Aenigmarchaeota archaeon]
MKIKSNFTKVFGDTPINRLWEFLVDSRGAFDYSMTDICEVADISWNTLKEIFPPLVKEGIVKETRKVSRATMYILNESHPKVVFMIGMHKAINMVFMRGGKFKIEMRIVGKGSSTPMNIELTKSSVQPIASRH